MPDGEADSANLFKSLKQDLGRHACFLRYNPLAPSRIDARFGELYLRDELDMHVPIKCGVFARGVEMMTNPGFL